LGAASYGARKNKRKAVGMSLDGMARSVGYLFLDSGAHTLFNTHTLNKRHDERYSWFANEGSLTKGFRRYLDRYASFLGTYSKFLDFYVGVDVIYNPELSWKSLKYLEREHGLKPIPVIHGRTDEKWVHKYLDSGYDFVGVGGLGQEDTRHTYTKWADRVFSVIGDKVRVHGFAMTGHALIVRFPWWSVDSASWAKAAGFGMIFVPKLRGGEWDFSVKPEVIDMSANSPGVSSKDRHYHDKSEGEKEVIRRWLDDIEIPLGAVEMKKVKKSGLFFAEDKPGETTEYGVLSEYNARAVANLKYLERLGKFAGVKIFFSGGSPIPESNLNKPPIMPSYIINARNNKPDARLRALMTLKGKAK